MRTFLWCLVGLLATAGVLRAEPSVIVADPAAVSAEMADPAQAGELSGTAMDTNGGVLPNAMVYVEGLNGQPLREVVSDDNGYFFVRGVQPGVSIRVRIKAQGFADWLSEEMSVEPGQDRMLTGIELKLQVAGSTVTVYARQNLELASQQLNVALTQRVLGIVPNFYVAYDGQNTVALSAGMKYRLAFRVTTDPMAFLGAGFIAANSQMAHTPSYPLGLKGYMQRVGATYADNTIDILVGGAVLPSLLHQDPRYYYQGTGTTRSRLWHAVQYPFVCMGDNGRLQPNYSTIGGDVIAAAASNLYYPKADRGAQLIVINLMVGTVERMASTVAQEFLWRRFTSRKN